MWKKVKPSCTEPVYPRIVLWCQTYVSSSCSQHAVTPSTFGTNNLEVPRHGHLTTNTHSGIPRATPKRVPTCGIPSTLSGQVGFLGPRSGHVKYFILCSQLALEAWRPISRVDAAIPCGYHGFIYGPFVSRKAKKAFRLDF